MDKINSILLLFLLFFLALVVLPFGVSPFETPKVILAEILIEILLFLTLLKGKINFRTFLNPAGLVVGILGILTMIDLIFFKTETTLFGNPFRLQGVFLLWHLVIFSILSSTINLPNRIYHFSLLTLVILTMSAYILGGDINGRVFGTLGEANSLAAAAIFFLPLGLINSPKWVKWISLLLVGLIILASGSRAGVTALLIQIIFLGLIFIPKINLTKALIISLLVGLVTFVLPIWAGGGWYENRAEIWYTSLFVGTLSPIFGHGFGNTQQAIHEASLILNNNVQYQFVDSAHNIFLDFWIQGGTLGVLVLVILIVQAIRIFLRNKQIRELLILLGLLIVLSFNPVSVAILIFFWWTLGQGFRKIYN